MRRPKSVKRKSLTDTNADPENAIQGANKLAMSAKKKHRMEKYVERKMQKDEARKYMTLLTKMQSNTKNIVGTAQIGKPLKNAFSEQKIEHLDKEPFAQLAKPLPKVLSLETEPSANSVSFGFSNVPKKQDKNIDSNSVETFATISNFQPIKTDNSQIVKPIVQQDCSKNLDSIVSSSTFRKNMKFYVNFQRPERVQQERELLPVYQLEQSIMEAIFYYDVVFLSGETGSGKTTQLPQFLLEGGFAHSSSENSGLIGITQSKRIAAISLAQRVGYEINEPKLVGYQVRFSSNVCQDVRVKFMTEGILLRELSQDLLLEKYSCIIMDEVHERNINTDILLGVLSRIVPMRRKKPCSDGKIKPLKLIIMSASSTVHEIAENQRLFSKSPKLISVESRQYPVTIHFNKITRDDYMEDCFEKVCKIHRKLPIGGVLVFVTGQSEVHSLCKRLSQEFTKTSGNTSDISLSDSDDEIRNSEAEPSNNLELVVLPLYSKLLEQEQNLIFSPMQKHQRLCVISTNVAETSLTIPGIKYVVDTGKSKQRNYDLNTQTSSFKIDWISKANAEQRAGRAGRTCAGHCYRLYSAAFYEKKFKQVEDPEITRAPCDWVVLQMKAIGIENILNFPFPTCPSKDSITTSEKLLENLGAIDQGKRITKQGELMSKFPISPRLSKMVLMAQQENVLPWMIAMTAAVSIDNIEIALNEITPKMLKNSSIDSYRACVNIDGEIDYTKLTRVYKKAKSVFVKQSQGSDLLSLLTIVAAYAYSNEKSVFCEKYFIRHGSVQESLLLQEQLHNTYSKLVENIEPFTTRLTPLTQKQQATMKKIIVSSFLDHLAKKAPHGLGYILSDQFLAQVFIHQNSILQDTPQYLAFQYIKKSSNDRGFLCNNTEIEEKDLEKLLLKSNLLTFSKPLQTPRIFSDNKIVKRECLVIPRFGTASSWDLKPQKIIQERTVNGWIFQKYAE